MLGLHLLEDGKGLARHRGVDAGDGILSLGTLRVQASLRFCNPAPVGGLNPALGIWGQHLEQLMPV